jgi:hypothetical protein
MARLDATLQSGADQGKQGVGGGVAVPIVDGVEPVQVDGKHGQPGVGLVHSLVEVLYRLGTAADIRLRPPD